MVERYCNECQGKGWKLKFNQMLMLIRTDCPVCKGSGYVLEKLNNAQTKNGE